ncbi:MAG: 4-phosphoerythronate dehydrogenase [Phycisphaerales bacterium]|nr:4-phosphoerythronate dehydrogenase [Phycisphaerales bacterium]
MVDEAIPEAASLFGGFGHVQAFEGRKLVASGVAQADALVVRSVTRVDAALLAGSNVRFVGSVTSGTDHIDKTWLVENGIRFVAAGGCNARPVAEYVLTAILLMASRKGFDPRRKTLGIVGVGRIGSIVADWARSLGMKVLKCDPPLQRAVGGGDWTDLNELLSQSDIVSLHVPLTRRGPDKTDDLVDAVQLSSMKQDAILINTSRGEVVCESALLSALKENRLGGAVVDVWRNEPDLWRELVTVCDLATPHVAGYSVEAKQRGVTRVLEGLVQWIKEKTGPGKQIPRIKEKNTARSWLRTLQDERHDTAVGSIPAFLGDLLVPMTAVCDLPEMDRSLRSAAVGSQVSDLFDQLRIPYWTRREFGVCMLERQNYGLAEIEFLSTVGFTFA